MFVNVEHPLVNPGAETGDTSGWVVESGVVTAVMSDPYAGTYSFEGGADGADAVLKQEVDLLADGVNAADIDAGVLWCYLSAWARLSFYGNNKLHVRFLDAAHGLLDEAEINNFDDVWNRLFIGAPVPKLTRFYELRLSFHPDPTQSSSYYPSFFDDVAVSTGTREEITLSDVASYVASPVTQPLSYSTVDSAQRLRCFGYGGKGFIKGTVTVEGEPAARRVLLLARRNMQLIDAGWSEADGTYEFTDLNPALHFLVLATDYTGEFNAVVADNVAPEVAV